MLRQKHPQKHHHTHPKTHIKTHKKRSPFLTTRRDMGKFMDADPLNTKMGKQQQASRVGHTYISSRSAGAKLSVLLIGMNSFMGQHLYTHLTEYGIDVLPVFRRPPAVTNYHFGSLTVDAILERGLPDVDFVINCHGINVWKHYNSASDFAQKQKDSREESNRRFAELIRTTKAKPYAYVTFSSTMIYPSFDNVNNAPELDENYDIPGLSPYLYPKEEFDQFDQQHGLTTCQRVFRNAEEASRVYIQELDHRSEEQMLELKRAQQLYSRGDLKSGIHGLNTIQTPEQLREMSVRYNLLTNEQVRSINIRLPTVLCRNMQDYAAIGSLLDWGNFGTVGEGKSIQPWIHVDDACKMTIEAMFNHEVRGPVNCVAPEFATSKEIVDFTLRANSAFKKFFPMEPSSLANAYGDAERAGQWYKTRKVVPKVMWDQGFNWDYPNIQSIYEKQGIRSMLEQDIFEVGGFENLKRNKRRSLAV